MASAPTRPTCKTCPYFDPNPENDGVGDDGICRRHAPMPRTAAADCAFEDKSMFPVLPRMLTREWCGEHPDFPRFLEMRSLSPGDELPAGTTVDPSS